MKTIPDRAHERLVPLLDRYTQSLPPKEARMLEELWHAPGAIVTSVLTGDAGSEVHVTALFDSGPALLMRLAPETLGLAVVDGQIVELDP